MTLQNKINGIREIWHFDNRWQLLFSRLFFRHERINIYRLGDMNILIDHAAGDANGAREIMVSPMYRQYLPILGARGPLSVLDIGANNGGFSLLLKANGFELAKVVCVELNPNTFSRMRFNVERNLDCEVVPINAAICGEAREFELYLGEGNVGDSLYNSQAGNGARPQKVAGMTFDDVYSSTFGDEVVDICKMDIEGAEFEVLASRECTRLAKCRYLIMEIHEAEGRNPRDVIDELSALGFAERHAEKGADPAVHFFVNSNFV